MDPAGFETRICDLDRVLCCHYTTGPEKSLSDSATLRKDLRHKFFARRSESGTQRL